MAELTTVEQTSDLEFVATRHFGAPVQRVFKAWTTPELVMTWWAPASFGITFVSCEMDVRTGGSYRFVFSHPAADAPMAFHGRHIEATPPTRLVWTNEEEADGAVTTVTFEARDGGTEVVVHDLYPSKDALDAAIASESTGAWPEQFAALDEVLSGSAARAPRGV